MKLLRIIYSIPSISQSNNKSSPSSGNNKKDKEKETNNSLWTKVTEKNKK